MRADLWACLESNENERWMLRFVRCYQESRGVLGKDRFAAGMRWRLHVLAASARHFAATGFLSGGHSCIRQRASHNRPRSNEKGEHQNAVFDRNSHHREFYTARKNHTTDCD